MGNLIVIVSQHHSHSHHCFFFSPTQLAKLLAKADDWQFDMFALEAATSGHALSVLGFALIKRTQAFSKYRLDEGRLAR